MTKKSETKTSDAGITGQEGAPAKNNGRFVPGDPRINRQGRAHGFDTVRRIALDIADEPVMVTGKDGKKTPMTRNGHEVTYAEAILMQWATSKNFRSQQLFLEYAYGPVPRKLEITGANGGPIEGAMTVKEWERERAGRLNSALETLATYAAAPAPETEEDGPGDDEE